MSQPAEASAVEAQDEIVEEMAFFDDWSDRYRYLIDVGRRLPEFPEEERTEERRIQGCQSQVWLKCELNGDILDIRAASDAAIVSGLIAMVLRVYSGRTCAEIIATPPDFISRTGLDKYLSPTRSNGLASLLTTMFATARQNA
jgi:cysteine desulfuration protein SufE